MKYKTDTELSNKVWQMKKSGQTLVITWKIVQRCSPYNPNSKKCYLCLNEKLEMTTYRGNSLLNKKTELWYLNADIKANTRFPSMMQRMDVSCIVRNHYIVTFRLLIIFSWRLLGSHHYETLSTEFIPLFTYIYIFFLHNVSLCSFLKHMNNITNLIFETLEFLFEHYN